MFVRNHMRRDPVTMWPTATMGEAMRRMKQHRLRALPVVGPEGHLLGMITERDAWEVVADVGPDYADVSVVEGMTIDPLAIGPYAPIEDALELFCAEPNCETLPVTAEGHLEGVITRADMLRIMAELLGSAREGARVEVALLDIKTDLARVFEVLAECDDRLISAITASVRDDGAEPVLSLRFAESGGRTAQRALARAGLLLLVPEIERVESMATWPGRNGRRSNGTGSARLDGPPSAA